MPELPEVETVRLQLKYKVIGKTIDTVEVFHQKTVAHDKTFKTKLKGVTIEDIDRVGKLLIFSFKNKENLFLLAHLKMTGQFFFVDKKGVVIGGGHSMTAADRVLPGKHTRIAFHFTDKSTLYFNDMRLFGYVKTATAHDVALARTKFGPEPIQEDFDDEWFQKSLRTKKTSVKAALLNQSFVAGLGNIYVDEALWRAKVKPMRRADTLTKKEAVAIAQHAGDVMNESIQVGGTTFQHFLDAEGNEGNFTNHLQVFGKQKTPCPRCGAIILKTKTAGRGTHYCPKCQK
jgi:formamidopyrimidine-DNA glycosylase